MLKIDDRIIWEQASGDGNRSYSSICLRWDVILNGPGHYGDWFEEKDAGYSKNLKSRKRTDLRRFSEEMKAGDVVILKLGQKIALGVGVVVGDYCWRRDFGDIDGWALQHVRRVKWLHKEKMIFEDRTFKWGDTTQKLISESALDWIKTLQINFSDVPELSKLPEIENFETDISTVSSFLFDRGMSNESINRLSENVEELLRIASWYNRMEEDAQKAVSEAETIAYLVIPFLTHLGWTPQKMAVEWNKVDVALFSAMPRNATTLATVVEVKKLGDSCLTAKSQAEEYAIKHDCKRLIVTDGIRYGVFHKQVQSGEFRLTCYLNITRLRSDYPIYECGGAQDAIFSMFPELNFG